MPRTKNAWLLALTSLALFASGCEIGPTYHAPKANVPDAWKTTAAAPADISSWWKTLNDPVLNDLIARMANAK